MKVLKGKEVQNRDLFFQDACLQVQKDTCWDIQELSAVKVPWGCCGAGAVQQAPNTNAISVSTVSVQKQGEKSKQFLCKKHWDQQGKMKFDFCQNSSVNLVMSLLQSI